MYISIKHDSIAKYWETKEDFFTCELGAYVNDHGQIVIPAPYYSQEKKDWISGISYNLEDFTKAEALRDFARNYSKQIESRYFYKLHYIQ